MQQTQTYKLNLLEASDAFSPSPLNENMEKVEGALAAKADAAATAALEQRVVALESHRIYAGTYTGDNNPGGQTIQLGFTPAAVIVLMNTSGNLIMVATGTSYNELRIVENGFLVSGGITNSKDKHPFFAVV